MTDREYLEFIQCLRSGLLRAQQCSDCGNARFYPRPICPMCGASGYVWVPLSGAGIVYSYTQLPAEDGLRTIALVNLDDEVRALGLVIGGDEVKIGDSVQLVRGKDQIVFERTDSLPQEVH